MQMQIDRMYYPVKTLGYGTRFGIWTIGCHRCCPNCSNPELREANIDKSVEISSVLHLIDQYKGKIDGVPITGGDPFIQSGALVELLVGIEKLQIYDTLVYTGYTIDEIKSDSIMRQALTHIGILIDGPYIDALNDNKSIRGSSNQHIMVLRKPLADRYKDVDEWERKSQTVYTDNCLYSIGIPHNVK